VILVNCAAVVLLGERPNRQVEHVEPAARNAIMDVLEHVPNVIVLSGDRHEFAAASIRTTVTAKGH
jgi:phosphodiesterase/alkaline phosphatase D-like protein